MAVVEKVPYLSVVGGIPGEDPREKFRYLNVMIHSPGGHGKTTFCATACDDPRTSPVLFLGFEGGCSIRLAGKDPSTFTLREIRSLAEFNQIYEYLKTGNHPYKSVVIDSTTEVQKLGLFEFVYGTESVSKAFKGDILNIKTAEIQHWGKSMNQMAMLVRFFRDLPIHSFFTALSQNLKDETSGKITRTVALPGKQADEIPGIPDIVAYLAVAPTPQDPMKRVMIFQPDGKLVAKDRSDALGTVMEYPTVTKVLDAVWARYNIQALEEVVEAPKVEPTAVEAPKAKLSPMEALANQNKAK